MLIIMSLLICEKCGEQLSDTRAYKRHTENRKYPCDHRCQVCDLKLGSTRTLKNHLKQKHPKFHEYFKNFKRVPLIVSVDLDHSNANTISNQNIGYYDQSNNTNNTTNNNVTMNINIPAIQPFLLRHDKEMVLKTLNPIKGDIYDLLGNNTMSSVHKAYEKSAEKTFNGEEEDDEVWHNLVVMLKNLNKVFFMDKDSGKFQKASEDTLDVKEIMRLVQNHVQSDIEIVIDNDENLSDEEKLKLKCALTNMDYVNHIICPTFQPQLLSSFYKHRHIPLKSIEKRNLKL